MQQQKVDFLAGKEQVKLRGPHIDLELSIAGRSFINSDGMRNMPSGEIFTGPVEESVNGWVRFSYPAIVGGRVVSGIELKFVDGKVTDASAEMHEDLLHAQLDADAGARYLGRIRHRHELWHRSIHWDDPLRRKNRRDGSHGGGHGLPGNRQLEQERDTLGYDLRYARRQ